MRKIIHPGKEKTKETIIPDFSYFDTLILLVFIGNHHF